MNSQKIQNELEYIVTFADFKQVYRRQRKKMLLFALVFGFIAAAIAVTKPIKYPIQASFKEKGQIKSESQTSSIGFLIGSPANINQSEATTWMKSEKLMQKLIKDLDLQGSIESKDSLKSFFIKIINNIKIEYTFLANRVSPNLKIIPSPLKVININYEGELPVNLEIQFINSTEYKAWDASKQLIGLGTINEPFSASDYSFTINSLTKESLTGASYRLTLQPLNSLAKKMIAQIEFKPDPKDKELLNLYLNYPDRKMGAEILNTLMSIYKTHQEQEQRRVTQNQISYLEHRQKETKAKLKESMDTYAQEQAHDVETNGFPNAEVALDFLGAKQKELHHKLMNIELEIKRINQVMEEGSIYYDRYHTESDPTIINTLLNEIRNLKQQSDSIHLTMQEAPVQTNEGQNVLFIQQMAKLEETRRIINELQDLLVSIQAGTLQTPSEQLLEDSRFMIKGWEEKLREYTLEKNMHKMSEKEWEKHKNQYVSYLSNLVQLFHVHEKALRERIAHQGDIEKEFRGINLQMANELFLENNRQLSSIESQILQYQFVIDKLQNPDIELNSLQSLLTDPISNNIITTYSNLLFKLRDEGHLSAREQDRIKAELVQQRGFLEMHVAQTTQVQNLTAHMLRKKINSLQKVSLALIQQQISLLEKQLKDYLSNRTNNLLQEKSLLETSLVKLKKEMSKIPLRWNEEQLIKQQLDMNRHFGIELANLVESKNITANLDVSRSTPVDLATAPVIPKNPMILLWFIFGSLFGALATFVTSLFKQARIGSCCSPENLSAIGMHFSGCISQNFHNPKRNTLLDNDLSTLRRTLQYLYNFHSTSKAMVVVSPKQFDLSKQIALLFHKNGLKTLVIHLSFDGGENASEGLLSYLEGKCESPNIQKGETYDCIHPGGYSRYGHELLSSKKFTSLLESLNNHYDRIVAVSTAQPSDPETECLVQIFDKICILVHEEPLKDLHQIISNSQDDKLKRITFITY